MSNKAQFDRNTLASVKPGLNSTLAEITEMMERYLAAPGSNLVALERARTELHSMLGVLKMVGLDGVATFCSELATMLSDLAANPQQVSVMHRDVLRRALFAITHYLDALDNGADNAALRLFPLYQEMQQLRGLEIAFELDLFYPSLDVVLPQQVLSGPPPKDAIARLKMIRSQYQQGLLRWLRQDDAATALQQMQQALEGAMRCVPQDRSRAFWWISCGLLECLKLDGLPPETNIRKLLGRIDQQIRTAADTSVSDTAPVMYEMLYLVGRSHAASELAEEIKRAYALHSYLPEQSAMPPGEVEQVLAVMRDQLRVAEESWELCVQGDQASCEKFLKYVEQLVSQGAKLDRDVLQYLTKQIHELSQYASSPDYSRPIGMDMAMALLLLASGIENYSRLGSGFQEQARILTERMHAAVKQQPEDMKQLAELVNLNYQLEQRGDVMGPLAKEMLVNLQHVEQGLNAFFSDVAKRDGLPELLRLLGQIQGGFRISSLTHAEQLLASVQDRLRGFDRGNDIPRAAERYALADALSALENYMQHLTHGQSGDVRGLDQALSEMVKLDQAPEPAVSALVGQQPQAALAQVVPMPVKQPPVAVPTGSNSVAPLEFDTPLNVSPVEPATPAPVEIPPSEKPVPAPLEISPVAGVVKPPLTQTQSEEDQELLDIFLEEAQEVLGAIHSNLEICRSHPDNHESLVTIRRGFHTLKGSGRMVGLTDLGEVAWNVERALNKWLQDGKPANLGLLKFIDNAAQSFFCWVETLGREGVAHIDATELVAVAQQVENDPDFGLPPDISASGSALEPEAATEPKAEFEFETELQVEAGNEVIPPGEVVSAEKNFSPGLFSIASTEAKQKLEILFQQLAELRVTHPPVVHYDFMRAAHTLAGVSRTMGFAAVAELASALEGWLEVRVDHVFSLGDSQLNMLEQSIAALDGMLHDIGDQQIPAVRSDLVAQLLADKDRLGDAAMEVADSPEATTPASPSLSQSRQPETGKPEINDELFAGLLADMDKFAAVPEENDAVAIQQAEQQSAAQWLSDAGKSSLPEGPVMAEDMTLHPTLPVERFETHIDAVEFQAGDDVSTILSGDESGGDRGTTTGEVPVADFAAILRDTLRIAESAIAGEEGSEPTVYDDLDEQLLPVFIEEADELGPRIGEGLRLLRESPLDELQVQSLKRLLHTMKGSSRMVGAMRIGEIAHEMEGRVAASHQRGQAGYWDTLESDYDRITALLEELRGGKPAAEIMQVKIPAATPSRRAADQPAGLERRADRRGEPGAALGNMLRVRADVVDRLVNEAGEISVVRSRMETEMRVYKEGLLELTASVARLRQQLREVEIQAESQMQARVSLAKDHADQFDPLEFDRFTRLQELTRFMNESVHDVQTVQQSMLEHLNETAASMLAQGRLSRELQQGLMNVRMVSFDSIADRLYRIVRQTGKELNKRANLELQGTNVELDRSVLEKMIAPFEHLLRNSIVHGLENEQLRAQSGKHPIGEIRLNLRQESNEVVFEFSDDGAGLNFAKLRERAIINGTLQAGEQLSEDQLTQLIFTPGLSTATEVTEIAGRGVGMDVVRSEISALGGRIDVSSRSGQGTSFVIHLPLTLAVSQILLVRAGETNYGIPATMIEQVRQVKLADMESLHSAGQIEWRGAIYPMHYLPHILGKQDADEENLPRNSILLLRSGEQRIALHVDEFLGKQEVMVKNIGPQLARLPWVAGATVLGSGGVLLILNPIQLAQRSGVTGKSDKAGSAKPLVTQPLIMVVDDSLTVRKITTRMLLRAGYQVITATDGVDALEKLAEFTPDVMLLDIEMPRMDGFALAKHLRRDPKTLDLPIIMITSRTAAKHREYAMQLGVNTYLGKPYQEDVLLQNIADFMAVHK
jgi:chemosensory pili system protein ChpA (sensor histidine kinase/response regulator)